MREFKCELALQKEMGFCVNFRVNSPYRRWWAFAGNFTVKYGSVLYLRLKPLVRRKLSCSLKFMVKVL